MGQDLAENYMIGFIDTELKLIQIRVLAAEKPYLPRKQTYPVYEGYEALKDSINSESPSSMENGFETGRMRWSWMETERSFISNAVQGMLIALAFAFVILTLSTLNIIIALFSAFSIGAIMISVMAFMELQGWEFGVIESLGCVISIGFSVDYVVHIANHYVESVYIDRHNRIRDALKQIGVSVLGGFITTFGAGCFLFFCILIAFNKFAALMVGTISFSLLFATLLLPALCHLCGPQGSFGDLNLIWKRMKCCKKEKSLKVVK